MWTSTVRSSMSSLCGQTVSSSCCREKTRPGIFEEMAEQAVFGRAELDRLAVALHAVGDEVHLEAGIGQRLGGEGRADAAEHRTGARDQLLRARTAW